MKQDFKITNEFHNTFEESLDNIMNTKDKTKNNRLVRKVSTIAASLIILAVVTLFSANAAGIINLDGTFQKLFGIENDERGQNVALQLASAPVAESTTGDVSARVIQSVNDEGSAIIMLELETKDEILNHSLLPEKYEFTIGNKAIGGFQLMPTYGLIENQKQTIEEHKAEFEQLKKNNFELDAKAEAKFEAERAERWKLERSMTNKMSFTMELDSAESILGKEISLSIDRLKGYTRKEDGQENEQFTIDCDINLKWKLSSEAKSRTIQLNKEYNGAAFKEIKLMPLRMDVSFSKPIDNSGDDYSSVYFMGVKYKDGTTEYVSIGMGSYSNTAYSISYGNTILDIDEVASIYVGENYAEIPLQ